MASLKTLFFLLPLLSLSDSANDKLPFKVCKRSDPKLTECLKDAVESALPVLAKGISSLGMNSIDPLKISQLDIVQGSGPVSIMLNFKDVNIHGIASSKVQYVMADWDKFHVKLDVAFTEPLRLYSNYKINGKILILPIQGNGRCNITLTDIVAKLDLKGKEMKKNGKVFMDVTRFSLNFQTSRLYLQFGNLFNGDKALGDNMNLFLNENWSILLEELQPVIEEALSAAFIQISNRIFHKLPLDQLGPK